MPKHSFGIIDNFNSEKDDYQEYSPQEYDCISIDDDIIFPLCEEFKNMDTFFHNNKQPNKGLSYCGITIIPPNSLQVFKELIENSPDNYKMKTLIDKIDKAISENRYMIHYGI